MVVLGFLSFIRFDIMGVLFGDILSVNVNDLLAIWIGGAIILLILWFIWKPLFASTVNYELAEAEGMRPEIVNTIFTILLAALIAISIKMVGLLLITGMLTQNRWLFYQLLAAYYLYLLDYIHLLKLIHLQVLQ